MTSTSLSGDCSEHVLRRNLARENLENQNPALEMISESLVDAIRNFFSFARYERLLLKQKDYPPSISCPISYTRAASVARL